MSKRIDYRKQEIEEPFQKNGTLIALLVLLLLFLIGVAGWLINGYFHRLKLAGEIPDWGRAIASMVAVIILLIADAAILWNMTGKRKKSSSSRRKAMVKRAVRSDKPSAHSGKQQRITYRK
jgi:protein-S-isoprenylcysteine O-methyltransferase Ste14